MIFNKNISDHFSQKPGVSVLLFLIIVAISFFLRLYNLDYVEFKGDEARNSFKALKLVSEGEFPLTSSISSTGINEPPMFMYLLGVPFIFSGSPVLATGFIALLNVSGIALCFYLLRKYFSLLSAVIATALFAVNPWHILFSRKIWTQNLLVPFVILFIYLFMKVIIDKRKEFIIYAFLVLGIILQLHLSALYFAILAFLLLIIYHKDINLKYLFVGIILMFITFIPYLVFQIKNDFTDVNTMLSHVYAERTFHTTAFTTPLTLITTNGFNYSFGTDYPEFLNSIIKVTLFDYISIAVLLSSILIFILKINKLTLVLLLWLLTGILYLYINRAPVLYEHYFNSVFPVLFIIVGIACTTAIKHMPVWAKYSFFSIITLLVLYQFTFSLGMLSFVKSKECIAGDYGVPYKYRKANIEKGVENLNIETIQLNIQSIHEETCHCVKCDIPATHFIIKYLNPNYTYWPQP